MNHRLLLVGMLLLLILGIGVSGTVSAASNASISFDTTFDSNEPDYDVSASNLVDDDPGNNCDLVTMVMTDATGAITDIDNFCLDTGTGKGGDVTDWGSFESGYDPTLGPVTYTLYDTGLNDACDDDENSFACGDYLLSGAVACIGENYFQPASLPAGTPYHLCGGGHASSCQLVIPAGSVVGDMPFNTQIYWSPGKVSPGNVLNPGTYIVIGEDDTGGYYKIVLACQFVWVPVDSMQPSYAAPQNGAPLPTTVVS